MYRYNINKTTNQLNKIVHEGKIRLSYHWDTLLSLQGYEQEYNLLLQTHTGQDNKH